MIKTTPKDFFLNLLSFGLFYTAVVSFIDLWFQHINVLYPELNQYQSGILSNIRWATSILVVVFPVFLITAWLLGREFRTTPEKREVWIRRWLVYLTLFAAAVTIIVDVVTLVYNYLDGGLTLAFFWKILVVLVVATAVFSYYLWDLRRQDFNSKRTRFWAWFTAAVVLGSVVYAFVLVGTPAQQRARKFDDQRVNDLMSIQSEVINYWTRKGQLPGALNDLSNDISGFRAPLDPQSKQNYEYRAKDKLTFELCANFSANSLGSSYPAMLQVYQTYPIRDYGQQNWLHSAGHVCFVRSIDPSLYKNPSLVPMPLKY